MKGISPCLVLVERTNAHASGELVVNWVMKRGQADPVFVISDTTEVPGLAACLSARIADTKPRPYAIPLDGIVHRYHWQLGRQAP